MRSFGGGSCAEPLECSPKEERYTQRIDRQIAQTEAALFSLRRAKEILEKYPDIEELLTILQRV